MDFRYRYKNTYENGRQEVRKVSGTKNKYGKPKMKRSLCHMNYAPYFYFTHLSTQTSRFEELNIIIKLNVRVHLLIT